MREVVATFIKVCGDGESCSTVPAVRFVPEAGDSKELHLSIIVMATFQDGIVSAVSIGSRSSEERPMTKADCREGIYIIPRGYWNYISALKERQDLRNISAARKPEPRYNQSQCC